MEYPFHPQPGMVKICKNSWLPYVSAGPSVINCHDIQSIKSHENPMKIPLPSPHHRLASGQAPLVAEKVALQTPGHQTRRDFI